MGLSVDFAPTTTSANTAVYVRACAFLMWAGLKFGDFPLTASLTASILLLRDVLCGTENTTSAIIPQRGRS